MFRAIFLAGVLPFVTAFLGGSLAVGLGVPGLVAAQSQAQEVRATRFVLVGTDGTTIGVWGPGAVGSGRLQLFDSAGAERVRLAGSGDLTAFATDGTTVQFRAGYNPSPSIALPPVNGVLLGPGGSISSLTSTP